MPEYKPLSNDRLKANLPDGATFTVWPDGRYDMTDANGRHHRGKGDSIDEAKTELWNLYTQWVMSRWMQGPAPAGTRREFRVPLN